MSGGGPAGPVRIAMWSGPRTVSTALMRAWENRPDTVVADEPLYSFYLYRTGLAHPGRDQVIASQPTEWRLVLAQLTSAPLPDGAVISYAKHMTHHLLPEVDRAAFAPLRHAHLIRDPRELLASYARVRTEPTLADLGLAQQAEIFETFGGPVVDSGDLLADPEGILRALCAALDVPFDTRMLSWPPARETATAFGPLTGTTACARPPASRPSGRPPRCPPASSPSPNSACRTTHGCTSTEFLAREALVRQVFDERNRDLIVNVGGKLTHRDRAAVSPFDSVVQGGDAVWEGLRLYHGKIFRLEEHLARLRASARALAFGPIPSDEEITEQISRTLAANGMRDSVHIRLTLTRGIKVTSGMDPRLNQAGPTLIVLAEFKEPVYDAAGITLITASVRRPAPDCLDPKIHHNNLLPSILAKIEANVAGADDAVMLDHRGFIAETNATHIFMVTGGTLATPTTVSCPAGITRAVVLELAASAGITCAVGDYTLPQLYTAEEAFVTGTMGGLAPVVAVDGRPIGAATPGPCPVTKRLTALFADLTATSGTPVI